MDSTRCFLGCVELISVSTPHKHVNVTIGESALLQCMFRSTDQTTTGLTIQWDFVSPSSMTPQQVEAHCCSEMCRITHRDALHCNIRTSLIGKKRSSRLFKRRLIEHKSSPPSSPGTTKNTSISIRNMQPSDAGVYTCQVHNFPDVDGQSEVNIIVNVLEKPSSPYCSVHGDVESGHRVTLTCHSERGSPNPKYTWIRLDQTKTRRPLLGRGQYCVCVCCALVSSATETGILEIRNISQFEFGEYQCNATNAVGFSICTIELSPEVGDGVIAGAVIGALLGCVLIVLVVWFIAHTLKKHKYNRQGSDHVTAVQDVPHI
uniref:V-set and immunoglobulin domain-containing protein 1 n=1 Tax=Cyclopterus lumpus TaxID=8103 RepID=A0A8C3GCW0_CYCLU